MLVAMPLFSNWVFSSSVSAQTASRARFSMVPSMLVRPNPLYARRFSMGDGRVIVYSYWTPAGGSNASPLMKSCPSSAEMVSPGRATHRFT